MRAILIPVFTAASLLALPALAQTSSPSTTGHTSGSTASSTSQNSTINADQVEQKLHQNLAKAGYTDIQIMPGSFLVNAKDSDGRPTQMMISPHSVVELTAMPQSGSNTASNSGSTGASKPSK